MSLVESYSDTLMTRGHFRVWSLQPKNPLAVDCEPTQLRKYINGSTPYAVRNKMFAQTHDYAPRQTLNVI